MRRALAAAAALTVVVAGCGPGARLAKTSATEPSTSTTSTTVATTTTAESTTTSPTTAVPRTTTTTRQTTSASTGGGCPSNLASSISNTYSAHQLVTVESSGYGTDVATVTLWQKSGSCWQPAAGPWSGFIGYNGFAPPGSKREGDDKTPSGGYGFGPVVYGNSANPGVHEAYQPLDCGDWWDEDSSSPTYNTFQDLSYSPCDTNPPFNNGSSEALWKETVAYTSFAVIDYNTARTPGMGSAIFFHASLGHGTAGCVSVAQGDLDWFLRWMEPSQDPLIVMGTAGEITRF